ncbi:LuxR family transcriptional regulator [Aurantimonas sp. Leaf443]|uniref:helix-turn-helix transcriptional regulator n=1 Tax=Aurantimonas sp. Leaf443 TaxID=1736378 RepID=UPI0006FF3249|nr:LuxR family transcriptional regulator [Aurantimonas sp. Leaf443]KQT85560.1 LysR family transcriptional regulator [Aurantimonas sp. Leaf443]
MTGALARLAALPQPWCEEALKGALCEAGAACGFTHAAVLTLPSTDDNALATRLVMGNWPPAFAKGYEQAGLHRFKLVLGPLRTDPMPFVWDAETLFGTDEADPSPAARFVAEARYLSGVILPVHGMSALSGALSFAGPHAPPGEATVRELQLFAFAFFGMLAACRFEENRRRNPLSGRERDCLKLAMLGKTSAEIGIILGLSEYTVSQYLSAATRKMDASNRTHAVALAAQLGYLS